MKTHKQPWCSLVIAKLRIPWRLPKLKTSIKSVSLRYHNKYFLFFLLFLLIAIIDRCYWSMVCQWREDQAANIWAGMTWDLAEIKMGLMSSIQIPNPNGMFLWGYFLSFLPDLWSISLFLNLLQLGGLCLMSYQITKGKRVFFLLLPLISFVTLRATGGEFWNQWILTSINIWFLCFIFYYLQFKPKWFIPIIIFIILLPSSLYLSGPVNSLTYLTLTLGVLILYPPRYSKLTWFINILSSVCIISLFLMFVWIPYFSVVSLSELNSVSTVPLIVRINNVFQVFFSFFDWFIFKTTTNNFGNFYQNSKEINHYAVQVLGPVLYQLFIFQSLCFFVYFLSSVYSKLINHHLRKLSNKVGRVSSSFSFRNQLRAFRKFADQLTWNQKTMAIIFLFLLLSLIFGQLAGGPRWYKGQRSDQIIQFIPAVLVLIFNININLNNTTWNLIIRKILLVNLLLFSIGHALAGGLIVKSHLDYRGEAMSRADVPVHYKSLVVDYVANDWNQRNHGDNKISIEYRLEGKKWTWLEGFNKKLPVYYKYISSLGRGFDYELLRRYGLENLQEGKSTRQRGVSDYTVSYTFDKAPKRSGYQTKEHEIGRYRVTVFNPD
jgi:hypothetical protein